ncbi:hypothetical protein [Curtobacterium sp. Curtsp57]|jgi:hypothetical protein|uniref:hypothetical protein n=1 Tax=Curtobacterium sp. Curtsp57 TaxID=3243047 RepID=UPI0039B69A7B
MAWHLRFRPKAPHGSSWVVRGVERLQAEWDGSSSPPDAGTTGLEARGGAATSLQSVVWSRAATRLGAAGLPGGTSG